MFGIGPGELFIICVVLIIAVGPDRLPQFMKTVGGTLRTLRQASRDIRTSVGIDEMMRPDPPPRPKPRPAPAQTQPRQAAPTPASVPEPVPEPDAAAAPASAPAPDAQGLTPSETVTKSDVAALFAAAHRPPPAARPAPEPVPEPAPAPDPSSSPNAAPPKPPRPTGES
jgi:Sec-independent protein translocase protein TatA